MNNDSGDMDLDQQKKFIDLGKFDFRDVDLNKPAMTAEEYLKQVIVGREQAKKVVVAPNFVEIMASSASTSSPSQQSNELQKSDKNCTTRFGPDKDWRTAKVNEFSRNRSMLEGLDVPLLPLENVKIPATGDSQMWSRICFERRLDGIEIAPELEQRFAHHKGTPPTLGLIKSLNDNQLNYLIMHQIEYVLEHGYTRAILEWIHALLLFVKKPLLHDVLASLRDFCRRCKEWRAELNEDEMDTIFELSWFITIISIYFAQRDLADL